MFVKDKKTNTVYRATQSTNNEAGLTEPTILSKPGFKIENQTEEFWIPAYQLTSRFIILSQQEVFSSHELLSNTGPSLAPEMAPSNFNNKGTNLPLNFEPKVQYLGPAPAFVFRNDDDGTPVPHTVTYHFGSYILAPNQNLAPETTYEVYASGTTPLTFTTGTEEAQELHTAAGSVDQELPLNSNKIEVEFNNDLKELTHLRLYYITGETDVEATHNIENKTLTVNTPALEAGEYTLTVDKLEDVYGQVTNLGLRITIEEE